MSLSSFENISSILNHLPIVYTGVRNKTNSDGHFDVIFCFMLTHLRIRSRFASSNYRVPTQTGKLGKMGRHFPFREFWTDWKSQGISENCYFLFLVIFKWTVYYLLKWVKFSVEKTKQTKTLKYWEKSKSQGILSVRNSGNHVLLCDQRIYEK